MRATPAELLEVLQTEPNLLKKYQDYINSLPPEEQEIAIALVSEIGSLYASVWVKKLGDSLNALKKGR